MSVIVACCATTNDSRIVTRIVAFTSIVLLPRLLLSLLPSLIFRLFPHTFEFSAVLLESR